MRLAAASLFVLLSAVGALQAQPAPFDMTPERPAPEDPAPRQPATEPEAPAPLPLERARPASDVRRLLLPGGNLTLPGEVAARSWSLHLTPVQATGPARLHLGYRNAIVVAPESSRLQVLLNDVAVMDTPISSAGGLSEITADLPAALLRAGRNEITVRVRQRHRTDCTIASTYELWTEIDSAATFLSFADPAAGKPAAVDDLRALAADAQGRAHVSIVAPAMTQGDIGADVIRLAQAIALYAALPDIRFSVGADASSSQDALALRVLLGSNQELAEQGWALPAGAANGPVAAFHAQRDGNDAPTLVISGRNREDWLGAIDRILGAVDRPAGGARDALITEAWRTPNAPMIYGRRDLSFTDLGIRSEQFSGRRYSTGFQFAIPADFYADAYGEARILLDAGYSDAVLPGSQINVYVNGTIAASVPLTSQHGIVLNRLPIKLTMRHFKPGLNDVVIEANLLTERDAACLPGATAQDSPRFAIFGTSRFVVPDFGRIAQRPDLAAMGGTGYPYGPGREAVPVFMERGDADSLSAAADLFARMALSAGRSIPVAFTSSVDAARTHDAVFIGGITGIPGGVLAQVGVSDESRTSWATSHGRVSAGAGTDQADAEEWRRQMQERGWSHAVQEWFAETFDLSRDMLRFTPAAETDFTPSRPATLLLAQGSNPAGTGTWTVVTAPDNDMLKQGVGALARLPLWNRLSGRITTLDGDLKTVNALPASSLSLIETQPRSFSNIRLITANWLSANILSYSLLLVVACVALGIVTSALLSRLGRRR